MLKFRKKTGFSLVLSLVILFCLFLTLPVLAESGNSDGPGGGQSVPLGLASSSPADGAANVAVDTQIKLTFNKNVINMSVKDNNIKCFALYNNGQQVPINVIMADDQIQPEYKREVDIAPQQPLQAGSSYILKIAPELQAKSGAILGQEVKVSFTTAGGKDATPTTPANNNGTTKTTESITPEQTDTSKEQTVQKQVTEDDTVTTDKLETSDEAQADQDKVDNAEKSASDDSKTQAGAKDSSISKPVIAAIIVVAGALVLYFFLRQK